MYSFVKWIIEVNITLQRGSRKLIYSVHYTCSQWALSNVILDMHCLKVELPSVGIWCSPTPDTPQCHVGLMFVCLLKPICINCDSVQILFTSSRGKKGFIYMCVSLSMHFLHGIYVRVKFKFGAIEVVFRTSWCFS